MASVYVNFDRPVDGLSPKMAERKRQSIIRMISTEIDIFSAMADADSLKDEGKALVDDYFSYLQDEGFISSYSISAVGDGTEINVSFTLHSEDGSDYLLNLALA